MGKLKQRQDGDVHCHVLRYMKRLILKGTRSQETAITVLFSDCLKLITESTD